MINPKSSGSTIPKISKISPSIAQTNKARLSITRFRKLLIWGGPLGFFSVLTAFFTYPTIFNFTQAVSGVEPRDRLQNLWNFWWIKQALFQFQNPFQTNRLFFPYYQSPKDPLPLYFHDLQLFNGIFTLPLQLIGGVTSAYNGVVMGTTLLSGLATYWLILRLGGSRLAGLTAGTIFAFSPFRLSAIAQSITNIQSTEFLPLYALFLYSAYHSPSWLNTQKMQLYQKEKWWAYLDKKNIAGAVLSLVCCIYTDWYNTIYLLAFSLVFLGWQLAQKPFNLRRCWWQIGPLLVIAFISFVLVSPLLIPSIANLGNPDFKTVLGYDREVKSSATLASLFLPSGNIQSGAIYGLGYTGLILGLLAFFQLHRLTSGWQSRAFWGLVSLVGLIMALGPELKINDSLNTGIPLPYALFRLLPVVSITRSPARFVILAMLGLAVLSAFTLDWLRQARIFKKAKISPIVSGFVLTGLIVGLVTVENWTPLPLFEVKANPFIQQLAQEQGDYNLLELPITRHYNQDHIRMFNQITHNRPILGGYLSRPVIDPYRSPGSPFAPIADLIQREKRVATDIIPISTNQEDFNTLVAFYNFRYIIIYAQEFGSQEQFNGLMFLLEQLYGKAQQVYTSPEIIAYRVPDTYLKRTESKNRVKLELGAGWSKLEEQKRQGIWRWVGGKSEIFATDFIQQQVRLSVQLKAFNTVRHLKIVVNGQNLPAVSVSPDQYVTIEQELTLVEGRNLIELICLEGDTPAAEVYPGSNDSRRLAFAVQSIKIQKLG